MNMILTLVLVLIPPAYLLQQSSAVPSQTKENLSVSIKDLRSAPTEVVLDGRSLKLSTFPWRDFMPSTFPSPNGSPMMVVLKVATVDKKTFPSEVRVDGAWVLFGDEVWEVSDLRQRVQGQPPDKDTWINCSDSPVCETTARNGPKWGPGVYVDVVVRLSDSAGQHYLLQAPKQYVSRSD
jgi:hypothetical protein